MKRIFLLLFVSSIFIVQSFAQTGCVIVSDNGICCSTGSNFYLTATTTRSYVNNNPTYNPSKSGGVCNTSTTTVNADGKIVQYTNGIRVDPDACYNPVIPRSTNRTCYANGFCGVEMTLNVVSCPLDTNSWLWLFISAILGFGVLRIISAPYSDPNI
ncbi:hypothetical protein [Pedobacter sp. BMA]|uniref:hypothetical protein n=1 Tax=Pedobacter sp. BMA TaxID=1663685 RepID=UPI000AC98D85|nr:hypothetical protein [Pedobacter sp. BMA]